MRNQWWSATRDARNNVLGVFRTHRFPDRDADDLVEPNARDLGKCDRDRDCIGVR